MAEFYDAIGGLVFGGLTVYGFFWNQGRAKKADEEKVAKMISDENEKQDEQSTKHNDEQHKRTNNIITELKDINFELGYNKGHRAGYKEGLAEARAQAKS